MTDQEKKDRLNRDNNRIKSFINDLDSLKENVERFLKNINETKGILNNIIAENNRNFNKQLNCDWVFTRDLYQNHDKAHIKRCMQVLEYDLRKFRLSH